VPVEIRMITSVCEETIQGVKNQYLEVGEFFSNLYFHIDFLFIHPPADEPHESNDTNGIYKRTIFCCTGNMNENLFVEPIPWIYTITQFY